jgi:hypothetical protein
MRIDSCPRHVVQRLLTLTDEAALRRDAAKRAAARVVELRAIVNRGTMFPSEREGWEVADLEFKGLLPSVPKLASSLAR